MYVGVCVCVRISSFLKGSMDTLRCCSYRCRTYTHVDAPVARCCCCCHCSTAIVNLINHMIDILVISVCTVRNWMPATGLTKHILTTLQLSHTPTERAQLIRRQNATGNWFFEILRKAILQARNATDKKASYTKKNYIFSHFSYSVRKSCLCRAYTDRAKKLAGMSSYT